MTLTLRQLVAAIDAIVKERNGRERIWGEAEDEELPPPEALPGGLADVEPIGGDDGS